MVRLTRDDWSMSQPSRGRGGGSHVLRRVAWMLLAIGMCPFSVMADEPARHLALRVDTPPGAIGRQQLLRGGPLRGYSQPVEIRAPQGALVSPVQSGVFTTPYATTLSVGLQIGYAYRFRISHIPGLPDVTLYPSIELVDRTYPPPGKKWDYPIPIEVTEEELRMAAASKMITRVVYIEDPDSALPVPQVPGSSQRYFEAHPGEDPLQVAQSLGRPVAVLRLGARGPGAEPPSDTFLFGSPPLELIAQTPPANVVPEQPAATPPVATQIPRAAVPPDQIAEQHPPAARVPPPAAPQVQLDHLIRNRPPSFFDRSTKDINLSSPGQSNDRPRYR